jgi:hypothetical protein
MHQEGACGRQHLRRNARDGVRSAGSFATPGPRTDRAVALSSPVGISGKCPARKLIGLPIRRRGRAPRRVVGRPLASLDRPLRVDRRCLHGRRCHAACGEGLRICRQCAGRRLSDRAQRNRRNSTTAANSPLCSKAVRIAAASASVTTNIPGAWQRAPGPGRSADGTRAKCIRA